MGKLFSYNSLILRYFGELALTKFGFCLGFPTSVEMVDELIGLVGSCAECVEKLRSMVGRPKNVTNIL